MSVWHWLIVLLVFGPLGWVIYLAGRRVRDERANGQGITAGFKGWLLVLAVTLWIGVFRSVLELAKTIAETDPLVASQFPALIAGDILVATIGLGTIVTSAWLLTAKSRAFRQMFVATAIWAVFSLPVSVFLAGVVLGGHGVSLNENPLMGSILAEAGVKWATSTIGIGLWLLYVLRSRRVATTCVK